MLHQTLVNILEANRQAGRNDLSDGTPADARSLLSKSCLALGAGPEIGPITDLTIPTRAGAIEARIFKPITAARGLIVYVHGGGWVIGTLADFDALARNLVARSDCGVLLIDYRLAPECPFPAGLEDVEDSIRWADANCEQLIDKKMPLIVAGDSAGGNLATVAAASLRHEVNIALQLLFYPVVDCDTETESYHTYGEHFFITRSDMLWFFHHYSSENLWADPCISPLRMEDLSGVASAWIALAECDVLRDEGESYAKRLRDAGVDVQLHCYAGMGHGFVRMMNIVDVASNALDDAALAISDALSMASSSRSSNA